MVRSPESIRGRVADVRDEGSSSEGATSGGRIRKLLLGLGLAAGAYAVVRKVRSDRQSDEDSSEWYQLSIKESVDDEASDEETTGGNEEAAATTGVEQGVSDEKLPDDASSDVAIEEDIETEPAEPGEMTVDEEVVEEMNDEDDESGAGEEAETEEDAAETDNAAEDEENEDGEADEE